MGWQEDKLKNAISLLRLLLQLVIIIKDEFRADVMVRIRPNGHTELYLLLSIECI